MHLMIDLETLGTDADCPVIAIGACFFDKNAIHQKFYRALNVEEQIDDGRKTSGSTIKWWMGQNNAAKEVFREDAVLTQEGIEDFYQWVITYCHPKNVKPWGHGPTFDIVIIEHLMKMYNVKIPWSYRNVRDLRTFNEFVYDGSATERQGTYHNALDDAITQAQMVIDGLKIKETE